VWRETCVIESIMLFGIIYLIPIRTVVCLYVFIIYMKTTMNNDI